MASNAEDTLYSIFAALAQGSSGSVGGGLATQVASGGAQAATKGSSSGGSAAGTVAKDALKSGLGLVGLVLSLFGVFDGGGVDTPPPLVKYALPPAQAFEAAATPSGLTGVDYDQTGLPRAFDPRRSAPAFGPADGTEIPMTAPGYGPAGGAPQTQVHVTVKAMDARSFLDRSTEIAAAVREAMLNLNSINDVVNDL